MFCYTVDLFPSGTLRFLKRQDFPFRLLPLTGSRLANDGLESFQFRVGYFALSATFFKHFRVFLKPFRVPG